MNIKEKERMCNLKAAPHSWGLKARKSPFLKARKGFMEGNCGEKQHVFLLKAGSVNWGQIQGLWQLSTAKANTGGFLVWPVHRLCWQSLLAYFPPKSIPLQALCVFEKLQAYCTSHIAFTTQFPTKLENKNKFSRSTSYDWYAGI